MPYIKEICKAGKTKEFNYYYNCHAHPKGERREKKIDKTCEAQKKVNSRQVQKKLTRTMNANFKHADWYATLKYKIENRPATKAELKIHIDKYLRALRKLYKKLGMVLKYIWVAEVGKQGAVHIHIIFNNIDIRLLEGIWPHGYVSYEPMRQDGQYRKLAEYFIKYSDKTLRTTGELQGNRYNPSRGLIKPMPKRKAILKRNKFANKIIIPKGYYLDADSVRSGFHEITGWEFFFYTVIQIRKGV